MLLDSDSRNKGQETKFGAKHAHLDRHWHSDPSVRWTVHERYIFHEIADGVDMHHSGLHFTQVSTELAAEP